LVLNTRELLAKLTALGCSAEPKAAQTGNGNLRTADSKIDRWTSIFCNCSARVLMVRSLEKKRRAKLRILLILRILLTRRSAQLPVALPEHRQRPSVEKTLRFYRNRHLGAARGRRAGTLRRH
jgi:hypothetical protein